MRPLGRTLVTGLSIAVLLAGCGKDPRKVFVEWPDVSYSTLDSRASYVPDMMAFEQLAAKERSAFYADAFTGSPQTTTDFPVRADFASTPSALEGNSSLQDAYVRSAAAKLQTQLQALLDKPAARPGSPLLTVLALSSDTVASHPGAVGCIAVFTDAAVIEPDFKFDRPMTTAERTALVRSWAPRLRSLRGAKVYIAGAGYGTVITLSQLEFVRSVLTQVLNAVGAHLVVFDERLPDKLSC